MERIQHVIDDHDAVLARHSVSAPRIEILEQQNLVARQRGDLGGKIRPTFNASKMLSRMIPGHPDQQRKRQPSGACDGRTGL